MNFVNNKENTFYRSKPHLQNDPVKENTSNISHFNKHPSKKRFSLDSNLERNLTLAPSNNYQPPLNPRDLNLTMIEANHIEKAAMMEQIIDQAPFVEVKSENLPKPQVQVLPNRNPMEMIVEEQEDLLQSRLLFEKIPNTPKSQKHDFMEPMSQHQQNPKARYSVNPPQGQVDAAMIQEKHRPKLSMAPNIEANLMEKSNDKKPLSFDPLSKYYPNANRVPQEVIVNPHRMRNLILALMVLVIGLTLMNFTLLGGKQNNMVEKITPKAEDPSGGFSQINDIKKIYEQSNEKLEESYRRLGQQMYQRMKRQLQEFKSISLSKLQQEFDDRHGVEMRENVWPIINNFRNEEGEISEKTEGEETIWSIKEEKF